MVLHDFLRALALTPLRLVELYNDRWSYYLTATQWATNLDSNKDVVISKFGDNIYRAFRLYLWGTAYQFLSGGLDCYRLVIASPNPYSLPTRLKTLGFLSLDGTRGSAQHQTGELAS
jgi:cyclopropane-fatty-acyl-phospholipid synthase